MADNVAITAGSGTTIASDDVGGVQYQRVKLALGADGAAADLAPGQAAMAASVPVAIASNQSDVPITLDGEAVAVTNAGITTIAGAVAGTEMQVDVLTVAVPSGIAHGQKTVASAGTEVALATSTALTSGVRIKAMHANTGWIYVGANPVTSSTGFVLDAGEEVFLEVANLATVYIDASVNGEGVSYIGA